MDDNQLIVNKALEFFKKIPEQFQNISEYVSFINFKHLRQPVCLEEPEYEKVYDYDNISQKALHRLLACDFIEGNFTISIKIPSLKIKYKINFDISGEQAVRKLAEEIVKKDKKHILSSCYLKGKKSLHISISKILKWKLTEVGKRARESYLKYIEASENGIVMFPDAGFDDWSLHLELDRAEVENTIAAGLVSDKEYRANKGKYDTPGLLCEQQLRKPTKGNFKILEFKEEIACDEANLPHLDSKILSEYLKLITEDIVEFLYNITLGHINHLGSKKGRPQGRKNIDVTQSHVAKLIGVSVKTIERIEKNAISDNQKTKSARIAKWYSKKMRNNPERLCCSFIKNNKNRISASQLKIMYEILKVKNQEDLAAKLNLERDIDLW